MMAEGTNSLVFTISAFWSSSRWPLATLMSSRKQRGIPLGGRYRQVALYLGAQQTKDKGFVMRSYRCSSDSAPHIHYFMQ